MNELFKIRVRRVARRLGIVTLKNPRYVRSLYSRANFPNINANPTIFDVGANIGQSVIELRHTFKDSQIYAFEPVESVYQSLVSNTKDFQGVRAINLGVGEISKTITIPKIRSTTTQTTQVLGDFGEMDDETESVQITTIDEFSESENIPSIDILKTDTEGFDLQVCEGMKQMLESKRVSYIISEVSIVPGDQQHTNLFALRDYLQSFDYELLSFFDLEYDLTGPLSYFNALFGARQE